MDELRCVVEVHDGEIVCVTHDVTLRRTEIMDDEWWALAAEAFLALHSETDGVYLH